MTRRHRVAHVLPRQYVVPSIGPPKTEAEIAREHCLPLCRVRPATPKTLEVLTTSEASLAASGLDFLVRVLVRPNATPEMSPCARLSLRRFTKKPTRSDLFQLVECSVEADSDEEISTTAGFQTPDLETPNIQTPGLQSYRSQSSESQIEMTPPPRKSKIQFFTPEKQLPSSAKPLPLSRQATSTSSPKQRKARFSIQEEEADGFGELVRLDTFENNVPYVPLRLFLDDWEERPNGTLRVGKLKRTISELMNGQAKIAALGDQILGDLSVSISHLNLAQLITFRAAQPVVPDACGNDALNSILARLDDFISETLINHAMSKRMAPTLEAMESMGGRESEERLKTDGNPFVESVMLRSPTRHSKWTPDSHRKAMIGDIPTVFRLKQKQQQNPRTNVVIEKIKQGREALNNQNPASLFLKALERPILKPKGTSNLGQIKKPVPNNQRTVLGPKEHKWIGRRLLLVIGAIGMIKSANCLFLKSSVSWWFISPGGNPNTPPPPRFACQSESILPTPPGRGMFIQFPSLMAQITRPPAEWIYALHLAIPPGGCMAPKQSTVAQWSVLSLEPDGDVRLLEPPRWENVMNELSTMLLRRQR